jgi:hypothetical protein
MRTTSPRRLIIVSIRPGPWWLKPLWSLRQQVGDAADVLGRLDDEALLAAHPVVAPDVRQETDGLPGEADPETIVLRQQRGLRRARTADTVVAGFVGAADGDLSTAQLLDALATLLVRDPAEVRTAYLPEVRALVADGFVGVDREWAD